MAPADVNDSSAADFAAGTTDAGTYVAATATGEVILRPKLAGEFTGDELPEGWSVRPWVEGGTGTLGDGMLTLDGASVRCEPLLPSPRSLEFSAAFSPSPDQHVGFGTNFVDVPWVMFSTKWGRSLYGRTNLLLVEDKELADRWFDGAHRFRIDWNVLDVVFSVDGARAAQVLVPMPGYMRALAANERLGRDPLRVEWMRLSPYATSGHFTSRILDAGTAADWQAATWEADVPHPTGLALEVRTGDVARPGRTWSPWALLASSGDTVGATSRYIQYRATLATTDPVWTPALREVRLRYSPAGDSSRSSGSGRSLECQ